jgi:DNA-binding protein HU-beta
MSTRTDLVNIISREESLTKTDANQLLTSLSLSVQHQLATTGKSVLPGFGTFKIKVRPARKGHNPRTGEVIDVPEKAVVEFYPLPSVAEEFKDLRPQAPAED